MQSKSEIKNAETKVIRSGQSVSVQIGDAEIVETTEVSTDIIHEKMAKATKVAKLKARAVSILTLKTGDIFRYISSSNVYTCYRNTLGTALNPVGSLVIFNHHGRVYIGNRCTGEIAPKVWPFDRFSGRELTREVVVFTPEEVAEMAEEMGWTPISE